MKNHIIDLHGDLFSHFTIAQEKGEKNIFKKYHLANFEKGNVKLSVFNVWIDDYKRIKYRAKEMLNYGARELLKNTDVLNPVYKFDDIDSNMINYIIGLEGVDFIDEVYEMYGLYQYGVRLVSLTWNYSNKFCASCSDQVDTGLSEYGRELVKILVELGVIIDLSHLSDNAIMEILEMVKGPVIASHSNVRALANHKRNLSDDMIKGIALKNGVIGINSYPQFVSEDSNKKNVKGLVEHINYIRDLVGIDYIALGFDFMDYLDDDATSFLEESAYMEGLKNHSEINNLIEELLKQGYSVDEIEKITHKNALRVFKEILA